MAGGLALEQVRVRCQPKDERWEFVNQEIRTNWNESVAGYSKIENLFQERFLFINELAGETHLFVR